MKIYKGQLSLYFATGEGHHFYVWTGEPNATQHDWVNHVMIEAFDIVKIKGPKKGDEYIIYQFPENIEKFKQMCGEEVFSMFLEAAKNKWDVEICKISLDS